MKAFGIVALLIAPAYADGPCADGPRHRIVRSAKGDKPIALAAAADKAVFGDLAFVELNNDGKQDVVFHSACIKGPVDSVRVHRVLVSCGPAADGIEELVTVFEEEELCARTLAIDTVAKSTKAAGVLWQDLRLTRTVPGKRCEQTTQALTFDGDEYRAGPRSTKPCPRK